MAFEVILLLLLGILVCVVLGANNASAFFGTSIGAGFIRYSKAAGLAATGVLLGVALEGIKLSKVVSGGILAGINLETTLVIIITILIIMTIATLFRLPLSLSGGLIGSAIGIGVSTGMGVNWGFTSIVFAFWVITPFFAAIMSIIIYRIITRITYAVKNLLTLNYLYGKVTLTFSFYVAYVFGANTVGLVNGIYKPLIQEWIGMVVFGAATALGIYFLSRGVTESVGKGIIGFSPSTALVAQLSGALTVHLFTQFGFPVSITQALIGSVLGIGLAKKIVLMNMRMVRNIVMGWTLAPLIGAAASYFIVIIGYAKV